MEFLIADTFTDSLARLNGDEQKATKTTAFDLQLNPANTSMNFHKLEKAKDRNFWSVRVSSDIRLIVHKNDKSMLCYVDHHDKAYDWAERRKLETHPKTGAAQLVEIRETVKEVVVPAYVQSVVQTEPVLSPKPVPTLKPLFTDRTDDELLSYGVPAEWLDDVKKATEDTLLALCDHLPAEAAEALLELATGGKPRAPQPVVATANPFDHPDAQRRFRVMTNVDELQRALDFPWEKWTVLCTPNNGNGWNAITPARREFPARLAQARPSSPCTVLLIWRIRIPMPVSWLTTFSDTLASALHTKLKRLLGNEPRLTERIDVHSIDAIGLRLYKAHIGQVTIASRDIVRELLNDAASKVGSHKFGLYFLLTEWEQIVDAWQLKNWEEYRDVARLGRKTRLPEAQRVLLWAIFERVRAGLQEHKLITHPELFTALATKLSKDKSVVFDFAVVDEARGHQRCTPQILCCLGWRSAKCTFFAGDLGQRIFQQPFSWKSLGVDIRGRSRTLRVNYRTSHQIRTQADRLLGPAVIDIDGNSEDRSDTVSVFNGPPPVIHTFKDEDEEIKAVGNWIGEQAKAGVLPHEFGVFVRSAAQLDRAQAAVKAAGLSFKILDEHVETLSGHVSICTMHLAKGLEFRAVVVMACDDEIIPLQERIETVGDDADLQEVYDTERHLLYVACTRARDHLLVTSVKPASEFLDDMRGN